MQNSAMASPPQKNHRRPGLMTSTDLIAYSSVNSSGFASGQSDAITRYSRAAPTKVMACIQQIPLVVYHDHGKMSQSINHTSADVSPNGMGFEVCVVDVEIQPIQSISDTHAQNSLPEEPNVSRRRKRAYALRPKWAVD